MGEEHREDPYPFARLVSQEDLEDVSGTEPHDERFTPVIKLKTDHFSDFSYIACPITNSRWKERWSSMCATSTDNILGELDQAGEQTAHDQEVEAKAERWRAAPTFLEEECNLTSSRDAVDVIGMAATWLELDSHDDWVRNDCEIALKQEIAYATYIGLTFVILPPPVDRAHAVAYGRAVRSCLESTSTMFLHLAIRLPLYDPTVFHTLQRNGSLDNSFSPSANTSSVSSPGFMSVPGSPMPEMGRRRAFTLKASESEYSGTWEMWDTIRSVCGYHPRLSLALDLSLPLPPIEIVSRWTAEPVSVVFLPASGFIPNPKEYPVLPKGIQAFIQKLMRTRPTIILFGKNHRAPTNSKFRDDNLVKYLTYLEKTASHTQAKYRPDSLENYAQSFEDYLQAPLQPLKDHLASAVYENFERDPVKYQKYEDAIFKALSDRPDNERLTLTVAGAGRGPLVNRSLKAIERANRNVSVYAIEKNPSAFVTLQQLQRTQWKDKVNILFGDMRHLNVPEQADILVSELLGSFGDNELSPECLDGAMRFLKEDGISIPSSYSAFLAPIQSTKLHQSAGGPKDAKDVDREKGLETLYVVMLQSYNFLAEDSPGYLHGDRCGGRIQQCWEFEHPRRDAVLDDRGLPLTNSHNVRAASLTFAIPHAGILHGFAGYFEAVLYDNIGLSIHPDRKDYVSKDMLSWFPCFFPVKEPLYLPSNSELRVGIWRLTGSGKVWYEWVAESFLPVSFSPTPPPSHPSSNSFAHAAASTSTSAAMAIPPSSRVDGAGTMLIPSPGVLTASPGPRARSPLLDAVVGSPAIPEFAPHVDNHGYEAGVVKIGQTSLHNPGGRSSWYGL